MCRSQEFLDESRPQPQPDRRMAQRLGRLEELMGKLVDKMMPEARHESTPSAVDQSRNFPPSPSMDDDDEEFQQTLDGLEAAVVDDTPVGLLLGMRNMNPNSQSPSDAFTPDSADAPPASQTKSSPPRYEKVSKALHDLFPSQHDVDILVQATPGGSFITSQFYSFRRVIEGTAEPAHNISIIPLASSHPSVLAKRLLQISICMQQVHPTFDLKTLELRASLQRTTHNIVTAVTDLVTSNDDFVATAEGLQCLVLQGLWHSNAGNLRKAWLSYRRAISFGQLIGIDRGISAALKYTDTEAKFRPSPDHLWYRIVACDRALSLMLGLPVGTTDDSFASDEASQKDTQIEKLDRLHTVVAAKIVERNRNKTSKAYALTQAIDCEMDGAARHMGRDWWEEPTISALEPGLQAMGEVQHLMQQVHHYDLLILLHLPFMLSDPNETRYDYSKHTCTRSSRAVLKRFITFRSQITTAYSCRHVDYSALIAAMTLLLSYLRQNPSQPSPSCTQRGADRNLIESVRERMQHVAILNHDKLSQESADILGQLMPIVDSINGDTSACGSAALTFLQLNIPYFGTINIQPSVTDAHPEGASVAPGSLPTAPLVLYNMNQLKSPSAQIPTPRQPLEQQPAQGTLPDAMDFSPVDPSLDQGSNAVNGMFMQFEPQTDTRMFDFPNLTAEADDWAFQGVDTTYWSLVNSLQPYGCATA